MRCIVHCVAETRMSPREVSKVVVLVANLVFHQNWKLENDEDNDDETESEDEEYETDSSSRTRHSSQDLTNIFPSRRSINRYLEDASFLNLEYVAQQILNKQDQVVTIGLDDTTKAAGHRSYDVKADHITIAGPSRDRKTLTTGYMENLSHSGEDGAKAYDFKLNCLAILAHSTTEELKAEIDFWMTDRAADCELLLQHLGVEPKKILKCCAHIILGVDHAIDKVFKDTEQKIGVNKLLPLTAGEHIFTSPASSIHTLGLIAISKLLSPSHAQQSISLYNDFKFWLLDNGHPSGSFKGFTANRFGRIAELAHQYIALREFIQAFFNAVVDLNSNKLVLAVSTFIQNDWFTCCSEIFLKIGDLVIFPLMKLLGIDERYRGQAAEFKSWSAVKQFFDEKLSKLEELRNERKEHSTTGQEKLEASVLEEVADTVRSQLSKTYYFANRDIEAPAATEYAPLTNLGCESEFSKLDSRLKASGGSASVQNHSLKNIIATNKLLLDSTFEQKPLCDRKKRWKWARCSDQVKKVKKLQADFLETISAAKKLALLKKEELKKKKVQKTLGILETCQQHGGPITPNNLLALPTLTEEQLLAEVSYLRLTIAPNIRQMRRVKSSGGKFKIEKFTKQELQNSIQNAVKPENDLSSNIDQLLLNAL